MVEEPNKPYDQEKDIVRTQSGEYEVVSDRARWNWGQVGAKVKPGWWNLTRQIVIFVVGIFCVIYVVVTPGVNIVLLIVGLVLIGIVPVDRLMMNWFTKGGP